MNDASGAPRNAEGRPLVVYWNNIPTPYFVERFNALRAVSGIRFEAWFNERTLAHRSWNVHEDEWHFSHRYVPQRRLARSSVTLPIASSLLRTRRPALLVSLFAEPAFILGWMQARQLGIKTSFRVLAPSERWFPRARYKEFLKRYMFTRADGLFVPGRDAASYVASYGVEADRVRVEPQVSDASFFASEAERARPDRDRIRSELGVSGLVFVYVGRLWWGKGVHEMLRAFALALRELPDTSLIVVGDGEELGAMKKASEKIDSDRIVFAGFRQRPEVPALLAASDVFLFPTLGDPYGLVVDEAMAAGLPVISTTAAGEIRDRVRDGETGYLVAPGDPRAMAQRMVRLGRAPRLVSRMGANAARAMRGRTPEYWASCFEDEVLQLLGRR